MHKPFPVGWPRERSYSYHFSYLLSVHSEMQSQMLMGLASCHNAKH